MDISKEFIGSKIKEARQYKSKIINNKYTQQMLADEIGIARSQLSDMERGRFYPNFGVLNQIANACEVTLDFFTPSIPSKKSEATKIFERLEKYNINKDKSFASSLIELMLSQGYFESDEDITEDTIDTIVLALKKDIKKINSK